MTITGSQETQTTTQVVSTVVSTAQSKGFFQSPGKVAGTFTVVGLVVLAIISALLYFFCFKTTKDNESSISNQSLNEEKFGIAPPPVPSIKEDKEEGEGEMFDFLDQRLDPTQVFNYQNGSRASLADDMDYTRRVLRVTNE